jgi:hypothetical protein
MLQTLLRHKTLLNLCIREKFDLFVLLGISTHTDFSSDGKHTSDEPSGASTECHFLTSPPPRRGCATPVKISAWTTSTSQPHFWHHARVERCRLMITNWFVSIVISVLLRAVMFSVYYPIFENGFWPSLISAGG